MQGFGAQRGSYSVVCLCYCFGSVFLDFVGI